MQGQASSSLPSTHRDYLNPRSKWPVSAFTMSVSHDPGFETGQQCGCVGEGDAWAMIPSVQGSTGSALGGKGPRECPQRLPPLTSLPLLQGIRPHRCPRPCSSPSPCRPCRPSLSGTLPWASLADVQACKVAGWDWRRLRGCSGQGWGTCLRPCSS